MVLKALYPASDTTDLQCPIPQILSGRYDSAAEVAGSSTRGGRVPADLRRSPPNIVCVLQFHAHQTDETCTEQKMGGREHWIYSQKCNSFYSRCNFSENFAGKCTSSPIRYHAHCATLSSVIFFRLTVITRHLKNSGHRQVVW